MLDRVCEINPTTKRAFLFGAASIALAPAVTHAKGFHATVGAGNFATLQAAVDAAPSDGSAWYIRVLPGTFTGQTFIRRPNVHVVGSGRSKTILSAGAYAGALGPDGKNYGTFGSATLFVLAPDCSLRDLTVENSFDAPAEMRRPNGFRADVGGAQAVALSLGKGSDRTVVLSCDITGHQDTLFCDIDRALLRNCMISGSYDFIFGGAPARFEHCEIRSRPRIDPVEGYIAAPSTFADRPVGLVFDRCDLTAEEDVPDASVFLGRPWRAGNDMKRVGMTAYLNCRLGKHIAPTGWTRMWYTRDGVPNTWFEPEEARFFEYRNTGPGAAGQRRGRTLTDAEAVRLGRNAMFGDWTPET